MNNKNKLIATILISSLPAIGFAQQPMVYPAKGQTPDQQAKDMNECGGWAMQQSGGASAASTQQGSVGKETLRGGARGAAAGAAIGAIAGDAGKGAAIGATAGGLKRRVGQKDQNKTNEAAAANAANDDFNRALSACLTGRGYSVQ
jgi:hypothetical protein